MAKRATKRGSERTDLTGSHDVVICGASFAGLVTARQLAGSGADVLLLDRYEIGERQTSACAIPTSWLEELGLLESEKQRFGTVLIHTAHGEIRLDVPWSFSTFDYPTLCDLLWQDCDATFETAKINGRGERGPDGAIGVDTDRGVVSAPLVVDAMGWKRVMAEGAYYQPPDAPLSRGLEVHPPGGNEDLEVWINRRYVPAGYGWSFPAGDEVRVGVGSFDPKFPVRPTTDLLAEDLEAGTSAYQGNWIPHKLRPATGGDIFFVGDSAGHCLPLTAEGIRPALYFGLALGMELRAVIEGRQSRDDALKAYRRFSDSHEWQFSWMLRAQKMLPKVHPRLVKPVLASVFGAKKTGHWTFNQYRDIAPPEFIRAAEARRVSSGASPVPG
ncbi:MAG: NAD(P)/FAD-dependent oxidoreductase [Actinomycetota bacterium]|nr:NAD(P)/FAD-dependent oxidoreductase [Actinomycetota bacterium]